MVPPWNERLFLMDRQAYSARVLRLTGNIMLVEQSGCRLHQVHSRGTPESRLHLGLSGPVIP